MSETRFTQTPGFRPTQLLSDTRYRAYTFQFIALIAIIAAFAFIGGNLARNLAVAGLNISYDFLGTQAGYDISQRPIPYVSTDTHGRASLVGLLNTLIVAFMGCVTATVLGVSVGVLRLSKNWLVATIMAFYIEIFRNVPVLIWILIVFFFFTAVMPAPRDFRGPDPQVDMFLGSIAFTNRGIFMPWPVWGPGSWGVIGALALSIAGIVAYRRYARQTLIASGRVLPVFWPSVALFFIPATLTQIAMGTPITLDYPELRGFNFQGGVVALGSLLGLWLALAIYTGAFIAENVRAGILAVPKGQTEAAAALGLRRGRIMQLVVLPQALRIIIPPLISQYLNLTKNSSLAIAIGYMDLTGTLGGITLLQTGRAIEAVLLLMAFYLMISLGVSAMMNAYNSAMKLKER